MKKFLLTIIAFISMSMSADAQTLYATPGELPGGANASLGQYTWTATNNNLLTVMEFADGELANYSKLKFTIGNKDSDDGMIRAGYYVNNTFTEFTNSDGNQGFGSGGDKTIVLTAQNVDLATVTRIAIGGKTGTGTVNLDPTKIYVESESGEKLMAEIGACGGNATYFDYAWTAASNNLWPQFEFSNGELANYKTLKFSLAFADGAGMVRIGYFLKDDSNFHEFGSGFGSSGDKTVDLSGSGIDLSKVTRISFGGRSGTGAVNLRNVCLEGSNVLALTDGAAYPFTNSPDFTAATASYSRTCSSQWGTLCLPFEIKGTYEGVTFYSLDKVEGDVMHFTSVSGSIAAGLLLSSRWKRQVHFQSRKRTSPLYPIQ